MFLIAALSSSSLLLGQAKKKRTSRTT